LNKFKDPVASYLEKRGLDRSPFFKNFSSFREIVVVIPCFDEMENLPVVINSILKCDPPFDESFGFLFVINHPDNASYERKQESLKTVEYLKTVCSENGLPVALIDRFSEGFEVPCKVCRSRFSHEKLASTLPFTLLTPQIHKNLFLVCLDADCEVAPSYFSTLKETCPKGL
jgi:hypothetical protein